MSVCLLARSIQDLIFLILSSLEGFAERLLGLAHDQKSRFLRLLMLDTLLVPCPDSGLLNPRSSYPNISKQSSVETTLRGETVFVERTSPKREERHGEKSTVERRAPWREELQRDFFKQSGKVG